MPSLKDALAAVVREGSLTTALQALELVEAVAASLHAVRHPGGTWDDASMERREEFHRDASIALTAIHKQGYHLTK